MDLAGNLLSLLLGLLVGLILGTVNSVKDYVHENNLVCTEEAPDDQSR